MLRQLTSLARHKVEDVGARDPALTTCLQEPATSNCNREALRISQHRARAATDRRSVTERKTLPARNHGYVSALIIVGSLKPTRKPGCTSRDMSIPRDALLQLRM